MTTIVRKPEDARVPLKIWAEESDLVGQEDAIDQALNLARHPRAFHHVALMPDFHFGYGMPIGGVAAMDKAVIPNAVGTDIGCGMMAVNTHMIATDFKPEDLDEWRLRVYELVPCGAGRYHKTDQPNVPPIPEDTNVAERLYPIVSRSMKTAPAMMGTLGDGNHFIELQKDENGEVWLMVHSGSRGVGSAICQHYSKLAKTLNERWSVDVAKDLAFLPTDTPEGQDYLREMQWAMQFAEENRNQMMQKAIASVSGLGCGVPLVGDEIVHTHHNYASQENHFKGNPWVHRKGAVRAHGRVIIPGSMGTASYICEGLKNPESFESCSHGAGRVMSRTQANKTITHEQALEQMKDVSYGVRAGNYDEMPAAYKDVDTVIQRQTDLVSVVHRLTPLAVVKG